MSYRAQMSVASFLHGLSFAYQKATKEILGLECEVFLRPTLEILEKMDARAQSCAGFAAR